MILLINRFWLRVSAWTLTFALGLAASGALAQSSVPGMPEGWESLPPDQLAAAATAYFETPPFPRIAEAGAVIQHLWDQYLVDDAHASAVPPAALMQMIALVQARLSWLSVPPGVDPTARLTTLMETQKNNLIQNPQGVSGLDFDALISLWPEGEYREPNAAAVAQLFATWMASHDWTSLTPVQKSQLGLQLAGDRIDQSAFSARWTGALTPVVAGDYRLGQLKHFLGLGTCRISVNGQQVFDSSANPPQPGQDAQLGTAVTLTASQPAALLVEYSYQAPAYPASEPASWYVPFRYPMLVLMWQTPTSAIETVPPSALAPPPEHAQQGEGQHGLWGEFFSSLNFQNPVASRLDEGIEFLWTHAPIVPSQPNELRAVEEELMSLLTQADVIEPIWWNRVIPYTAGLGNFSQRQQVLAKLQSAPDTLAAAQPYYFAKTVRELSPLSSAARQWLLSTWGGAHPVPSKRIGDMPAPWMYYNVNHVGYQTLAHWNSGTYSPVLDELTNTGLADEQGRPYQALIAVAAHHAMANSRIGALQDWVANKVEDQLPVGDLRALWLMAQGWVEEASSNSNWTLITPATSLPLFEEALGLAESPEVKFEVLSELAVREICLGECAKALERIDAGLQEFNTPDQQAQLATLKATAERYKGLFEEWIVKDAQQQAKAANDAYIAQLQARIEKAQQRGDSATATKYQQQLQQVSGQ